MWDGVRNYQARNNLKNMKKMIYVFIILLKKAIIGIVKVVKEYYVDPQIRLKNVAVDVKIFSKFRNSVSLDQIKSINCLKICTD